MYRLILDLPFDIVGIWNTLFTTEQVALNKMRTLPSGFEIIHDKELEQRTGKKKTIILPFDKELENHVP